MTEIKQAGRHTQLGTAFLQDMVGHGADILSNFTDLPPESCEQIAFHLADRMTTHWGGSMLYVPKSNPVELHKRDLAIWQDFNGTNHHQLAQKYHLSMVTIYQIIAKVRKALPKTQEDLFDKE